MLRFSTLGLMLDYQCNIRCRSCLWGDELGNPVVADLREVRSWIDQAQELGTIHMVGISGAEPFVRYEDLRAIMYYAGRTYGLPSGVVTNAKWAESPNVATMRLQELWDVGMRGLMVSVDDFHQEWVPLSRVRNCLDAGREIGMECTLQTVVTKTSKKLDDYIKELGYEEWQDLHTSQFKCTPIGAAAKQIPVDEFEYQPGIPNNYCTLFRVVNVLPDGSVYLCCGAAFTCPSLKVGNLRKESLGTILERAEWDPLLNSLAIDNGPRQIAERLRRRGRMTGESYCSPCHACHDILGQRRLAEEARRTLEPERAEIFAKRTILSQLVEERAATELSFFS